MGSRSFHRECTGLFVTRHSKVEKAYKGRAGHHSLLAQAEVVRMMDDGWLGTDPGLVGHKHGGTRYQCQWCAESGRALIHYEKYSSTTSA
jgi:hypothetical protein